MNLGRKIAIVGVSASGKSTFARILGNKLNLRVTYIDSIMWKPGWEYIGDEQTNVALSKIIAESKWIIEGYINKEMRTSLFEAADSIIYLDYSSLVSSGQYIKRWWKHRTHPRPELTGSPEKFSFAFLNRIWKKEEAVSLITYLEKVVPQEKIIKFTSPTQTKDFLKLLQ